MNKKVIICVVAAAAAAITGWLAYSVIPHSGSASAISSQPTTTSQGSSIESADSRLREAISNNSDTVAWLTIPDTNIDVPVLQGTDNDYYLRRDPLGNADNHGCVFADYETTLSSVAVLSRNVVLYGHTFTTEDYKEGFYELTKYEDSAWATAHREIYLSIPDAKLTYEVVSVGYANVDDGTLPIYPVCTDTEFAEIIAMAHERNIIDFSTATAENSITTSDSILTLATCTDDANERLVVVAKLKE